MAKNRGVEGVFRRRLRSLRMLFSRVKGVIGRTVCVSIGNFIGRSGRLTTRIVTRSITVGRERTRVRGEYFRLVTLRRPIANGLHEVIAVVGTYTSLRHVTSRTIDVTGSAVHIGNGGHGSSVRTTVTRRSRGMGIVIRRMLTTCVGASVRGTGRITLDSGVISRTTRRVCKHTVRRVGLSPRLILNTASCVVITNCLRQVNSCMAGVYR